MSILDDLPEIIGDALGDLVFYDATLRRDVTEPPDPATPWEPGSISTEVYSCKAIHEEWSAYYMAGGLVLAGDRRVLVLASTLKTEPAPGDRITIRGETFTVVQPGQGQPAVSTDPARAIWTLRATA